MQQYIVSGNEKEEEVLITRISIVNRSPEPVTVAQKFIGLFHGNTKIKYGKHTVRYPVTHTGYQRLVTAFINEHPNLRVDIGSTGIELV
jgi:hypothetical protein